MSLDPEFSQEARVYVPALPPDSRAVNSKRVLIVVLLSYELAQLDLHRYFNRTFYLAVISTHDKYKSFFNFFLFKQEG